MEKTGYVPYQLCPKCHGDGNLLRFNSPSLMSTADDAICDVCKGEKIIPMAVVPEFLYIPTNNEN